MFANSNPVTSSQRAVHACLGAIVQRHLSFPYQRPISAIGLNQFEQLLETVGRSPRPLILDSGCGTGESTFELARQWPNHWVVGVDKSAARLSAGQRRRNGQGYENAILLRCCLVDFFQLSKKFNLNCARHYLLYPNPWPKPGHLKRRWHAHPAFPDLLSLKGTLELRCNWRIYADEFAYALECAGARGDVESFTPQTALTPFERKYAASGHLLWRCVAQLTDSNPSG